MYVHLFVDGAVGLIYVVRVFMSSTFFGGAYNGTIVKQS